MNILDPQRVLEAVVETALHSGFGGFDGAEVCLLDPERGVYHVLHNRGLPAAYQRDERPADEGIVGRVLERREVTVVTDYGVLPDADPAILDAGFRMAVGAPVMSHGDLLGVLVAGRRSDERPSKDELEAFELLALQAGRALDNARAFEEQRRTAERLAEVDRLKDEFLSTASHELRTPLTVIGGMCSTLESRWEELSADGQAHHFLHRISANAQALNQIVETLLDFSRLQQDRLPVSPEQVDLAGILQQVGERLESLFGEHELHCDIEPALHVRADAALLHRAVENLLTNAAKYTPPGSRVVLRGAREGDRVVAAVEDNGPGVDPADLKRLTERFFRGKQATIRPSRGLGLGLAFTEELLRLHGSRLEVDSEPDAGATFAFRLPLDDGPPPDTDGRA